MRPLTKLELRLLLHLEGQRVYTTLSPSMHQALLAPRLTLPPRWQNLERTAQPRSLSLLTTLPKRLSSVGLLKKELIQPREWPLMPPSPQMFLKIDIKRKRYLPGWRLF